MADASQVGAWPGAGRSGAATGRTPARPQRLREEMSTDFFQIIHVLPRSQFRHTPSFLGLRYSDDLIILEITFISDRPREKQLALLKTLNDRVVAAGISPDDLLITLYETPGENISFGNDHPYSPIVRMTRGGLAQRAHISANN